ncbi:MAG TPA: MerR family transcriptional regulator [Candidatus Binatia bacterium]|nr:MerR family transcriptional regulator [Candidatus Binatia bacterium]
MKIGQVAVEAGVPASAIRFYESAGVLPRPARRNGVREYGPEVVEQLRVLRFFRSAGVSTQAIAVMFAGASPVTKARNRHEIVLKRMAELDEVITEARRMRRRLTKLLACDCRGDTKRCVIFKEKRPDWSRRRVC